MKKLNFLTKLLLLCLCLVGSVNGAWATPNIVNGKTILSPWVAKAASYSNQSTVAIASYDDGFIGPAKNSFGNYITYTWYSMGTSEAISVSSGEKIVINAKNSSSNSYAELVVRYSEDDKTYTNLADFTSELRSGGAGYSDYTELEVPLSGLTSGNSYYFQIIVKAVLINSASKGSSCTSVAAPTGLSCSAQTKNSLTFSWTAAENASSYNVTLYSDSECTDQVATANVTTTSKEFTDLSGGTTYYCKVQSKGNGSTYCSEGNVTDAASGTTASKDYTVTAASNNNTYGTASAEDSSLDKDETTTVTASAKTGYKFRNWSVSGTGASLTSTTTNPTTLTMGTADATVTANFSELEHYTITYNKGANGSGTIANGDKTEDAAFTLSSSTFTYAGHVQTGWATSDGGDKVYELGGTYTGNADLTLYPYWIEQYTITYDKNGGSGYTTPTTDAGEITLRANSFYKSGYSFLGWATSQSNADAGIVAYADKAAYTLSANATLYAVWGENYCEMKVATSGSAPSEGNAISMQSGAFGGTMTVLAATGGLAYSSNGLQSSAGYTASLNIVINDYLKPGSILLLTLYSMSSGLERGYELYSLDGNTKIATLASTNIGTNTYIYTVSSNDKLDGTKGFRLVKVNTNLIYLKSLTVTDCQPGGVISASGWNTYSSNKKLDLSTISGGTAYIATTIDNTENKVKMVKCTDIVDAEEGLMIKGTAGDKFTINTTSSAATLSKTNLMQGLPNGGTVDAEDGNYVFGWPSSDATAYGFYYVNKGATLGIGKSYLHVDGGGSARLTIVFDEEAEETTGISASLNDKEQMTNDKVVYDLQGRKVAQPARGLYIVGGKKVIIK